MDFVQAGIEVHRIAFAARLPAGSGAEIDSLVQRPIFLPLDQRVNLPDVQVWPS